MNIERHPLPPFFPPNTRIWLMGSFPPPQSRWSIDFYYPNFNNDMWRIFGHIFFGDKNHFTDIAHKRFYKQKLVDFLEEKGIAFYDTATSVNRLKDNASDKYLEIIEPTPVDMMLQQLPECNTLATTGQKATDTLCNLFQTEAPPLGGHKKIMFFTKEISIYRMPSSSRAYPLPLEKKAEYYRKMFAEAGVI